MASSITTTTTTTDMRSIMMKVMRPGEQMDIIIMTWAMIRTMYVSSPASAEGCLTGGKYEDNEGGYEEAERYDYDEVLDALISQRV